MDPVSHAIVGRLLITAGTRSREGYGVGAAGILGALSPDIDAVLMPVGWDLYLRIHQIGTHTLLGTMVCGALVATVVRACSRGSLSKGRWSALFVASCAGALSHVALDLASGASMRPLWPFSGTVTRFGVIAMAEPSIVALLLVAAIVFWRWPARRLNAAITALTLVLVILVGKAAVRAEAERLYEQRTATDSVRSHALEAAWGVFSEWVVIDRTEHRVRRWRVNTARSSVGRELDVPVATETGWLAASINAKVVRNFLAAHEFPLAITMGEATETEVQWSDLGYCWSPTAPGALPALVGSAARPADLPVACGLWFGVAFDTTGALTRQFVTIGNWVQER
jgi:membrane-bound metal-dependent hydrolase YbcI (DUF457 family)